MNAKEIFNSQLDQIRALRTSATPKADSTSVKTSSSSGTVDKISSKVHRLRNMGTLLEALGTRGFEKVAMEAEALSTAAEGPTSGGAYAQTPQALSPNLVDGNDGNVEPTGGRAESPARACDSPMIVAPAETAPEANLPIDREAPDGAKASSILHRIVAGRYPVNVKTSAPMTKVSSLAVLNRMGLRGANDAFLVFTRTAQGAGVKVSTLLDHLELHLPDKGLVWRKAVLSQAGHIYKTSEELENDVARAKAAVEAVVKSQLQLPESSEIAKAVNVSPMAADIAIHETAELIAATGGQVGNSVSPMAGAAPPAMPDVGMPAPDAGAVAAPPMMPAPGPAPTAAPAAPVTEMPADAAAMPADAAAMPADAAAMPADAAAPEAGGMVAQASAGSVKSLVNDPLRLAALLDNYKVSETVADDPAKAANASAPVAGTTVVSPVGTAPAASLGEASVNDTLRGFLSSDAAAFSADPNEVAAVNDGDVLSQFATPIARQDSAGVSRGDSLTSDYAGSPNVGNEPVKASTVSTDAAALQRIRAALTDAFPV